MYENFNCLQLCGKHVPVYLIFIIRFILFFFVVGQLNKRVQLEVQSFMNNQLHTIIHEF